MTSTEVPLVARRARGGKRANKFYSKLSEEEKRELGVDWDPQAALQRGRTSRERTAPTDSAPPKRVERTRSRREHRAPVDARRERQAPAEGPRERPAPSASRGERAAPSDARRSGSRSERTRSPRRRSAFVELGEFEGAPTVQLKRRSPSRARAPIQLDELIEYYHQRKEQIEQEGLGHEGPIERHTTRKRRKRAARSQPVKAEAKPEPQQQERQPRPSSTQRKAKTEPTPKKWIKKRSVSEASNKAEPSRSPTRQAAEELNAAETEKRPTPPAKPPTPAPSAAKRASDKANEIAKIKKQIAEATTVDEIQDLEAALLLITDLRERKLQLLGDSRQRAKSAPGRISNYSKPPGMPGIDAEAQRKKNEESSKPSTKAPTTKKVLVKPKPKGVSHTVPLTSESESNSPGGYRQGMPSPSPTWADVASRHPKPGKSTQAPPPPIIHGAVDFHNVLDTGPRGSIPERVIRGIQSFNERNPSVRLGLLSYAGMFTQTGTQTNAYVNQVQRRYGTLFPDGVYITNKRTGRSHYDKNLGAHTTPGKASYMFHHNVAFLIDDSEEIGDEVEQCGMRAYRIRTSRERHEGHTVFADVLQVLEEVERQLKHDRAYFYVEATDAPEWNYHKKHRR